jgi:outer membrane receptor protein involved in Fe transport
LTYHFSQRFDLQIGGRESQIRQSYTSISQGSLLDVFSVPNPSIVPLTHSKEDAFTYLVTPRFKITPDVMVYARAASGYRAGGLNTAIGLPAQFSQYRPDKTNNFELGAKADLLAHRLSLDASIYYIDWKDIQLQATPVNGFGFYTNAGGAKSQGVELSLQAKPMSDLTLVAWAAWNDAQLTSPFPAGSGTYAAAGDRLPYAGRFSGSVSLQKDFAIYGRATGFAGGTLSYVGDRQGEFTSTPQRQVYGGYAKIDLRTGVRIDTWAVTAYVRNLFDKRAMLSGGLGTTIPFAFYEIEPRSIGLSVAKSY